MTWKGNGCPPRAAKSTAHSAARTWWTASAMVSPCHEKAVGADAGAEVLVGVVARSFDSRTRRPRMHHLVSSASCEPNTAQSPALGWHAVVVQTTAEADVRLPVTQGAVDGLQAPRYSIRVARAGGDRRWRPVRVGLPPLLPPAPRGSYYAVTGQSTYLQSTAYTSAPPLTSPTAWVQTVVRGLAPCCPLLWGSGWCHWPHQPPSSPPPTKTTVDQAHGREEETCD